MRYFGIQFGTGLLLALLAPSHDAAAVAVDRTYAGQASGTLAGLAFGPTLVTLQLTGDTANLFNVSGFRETVQYLPFDAAFVTVAAASFSVTIPLTFIDYVVSSFPGDFSTYVGIRSGDLYSGPFLFRSVFSCTDGGEVCSGSLVDLRSERFDVETSGGRLVIGSGQSFQVVPLPATLPMAVGGLALLSHLGRRRGARGEFASRS